MQNSRFIKINNRHLFGGMDINSWKKSPEAKFCLCGNTVYERERRREQASLHSWHKLLKLEHFVPGKHFCLDFCSLTGCHGSVMHFVSPYKWVNQWQTYFVRNWTDASYDNFNLAKALLSTCVWHPLSKQRATGELCMHWRLTNPKCPEMIAGLVHDHVYVLDGLCTDLCVRGWTSDPASVMAVLVLTPMGWGF